MLRLNLESSTESKEQPRKSLRLFNDISGGTAATLKQAEAFMDGLPPLPPEPYAAAREIRRHLIDSGYVYDNTSFVLPDLLKKKAGNCIGLTALIGSALEARGFSPEYEVIMNPRDGIYRMDLKLMHALQKGEYFDYNDPQLPEESSEFHDYRFVPLEHPALVLGGKRFETTNLDVDQDQPENWSTMGSDRLTKISFRELCGAILVDRARVASDFSKMPYQEVKDLLIRGIRLWPGNREAYATAKDIAEENFDDAFREAAVKKYLALDGDDARFYFTRFEWLDDPNDLDRALELFPAYVQAYLEKNVDRASSDGDARFAFSVAAYCCANSGELDLRNLYLQYGEQMVSWIGKDEYLRLSKKLKLPSFNPVRHALLLSKLGDAKALERYVGRHGWPKTPKEQTILALAGKGTAPMFAEKLTELRNVFGAQKSFIQLAG